MVAYGNSLRQARRLGWEEAYCDYEKLKLHLNKIADISVRTKQGAGGSFMLVSSSEEDPLLSDKRSEDDDIEPSPLLKRFVEARESFLADLQAEIEKVALFALKKQGELADAVGALRFKRDHDRIFSSEKILQLTSRLSQNAMSDERELLSALGVELLHLLRFICINATGVRKILKKYRKVTLKILEAMAPNVGEEEAEGLMMRDLHHLPFQSKQLEFMSKSNGSPVEAMTLDGQLQQLANSDSIATIHASLCFAAGDELAYQTSLDDSTPQLRLRFVMASIQTLRVSAEMVNSNFRNYLSRKAMITTGTSLWEIEGATLEALRMLLRFEPDTILHLSHDELRHWYDGMQRDSTKLHPERSRHMRHFRSMSGIQLVEGETKNHFRSTSHMTGEDEEESVESSEDKAWGGVDSLSLTLNFLSTLLYTVNYYIVAPNANHYSILLGYDGAFGATLIGASSFAAIFAAFVYSVWYTKSTFKSALVFSSFCPLIGNAMYSLAISYRSMSIALWGRILCGFGSAEVVNRQLISACVCFDRMTRASALFVAAGAAGMSIGPLLGSIFDLCAGRDKMVDLHLSFLPAGGIIYNHVTAPGFFMSTLWLFQLLALLLFFKEPDRVNGDGLPVESEDFQDNTPKVTSYGTDARRVSSSDFLSLEAGADVSSSRGKAETKPKGVLISLLTEIRLTLQLVFGKIGLPITLLLFCYIEMADEVLISSCSMICRRYFGWHGSAAGLLIASLGALVLPADFVVERASHVFSERRIMKFSLLFIIGGLVAIMNYEGLIYDIMGAILEVEEDVVKETDVTIGGKTVGQLLNKRQEFPYDWDVGHIVYIVFLSSVFMGTIILEGVDTSLMAKVTPAKLNHSVFNSGLLATLIGTLGRVFADLLITVSALVDVYVFVDFVNATFLPLLLLAVWGYFLVRKHYKEFLMS